jgi:Fe-S cluster assembly protein SufD
MDLLPENYKELLLHYIDNWTACHTAPAYLQNLRAQAKGAIQGLSFPTRKMEEWKYTTLDRAIGHQPLPPDPLTGIDPDWLEQYALPGLEATRLVCINGEILYHDPLPKGVRLERLEQWPSHLPEPVPQPHDIFEQIHTALLSSHWVLGVAPGVSVEKPIHCINLIDNRLKNVLCQHGLLMQFGAGAQCNLLETQHCLGKHSALNNSLIQLQLAPNSVVGHVQIQQGHDYQSTVQRTHVYQAGGSTYSNYLFSLSGQIIRNNLHLSLQGEHTEAKLYGLYLAQDHTHIDNHTLVDHQVPNCQSNQLYKGVLGGSATGVFNGKIYVRPQAQKTNAYQQNRNLLLSDKATMNTKPQLEIWADDVKCSHGCTIGQLDEGQLFYLRARGIGPEASKAMMVYAFASEIVEKVNNAHIRDYLLGIIANQLNFSID